jgi:hypothetical protein
MQLLPAVGSDGCFPVYHRMHCTSSCSRYILLRVSASIVNVFYIPVQISGRTPWMAAYTIARPLSPQENTRDSPTTIHATSGIRTCDPSVTFARYHGPQGPESITVLKRTNIVFTEVSASYSVLLALCIQTLVSVIHVVCICKANCNYRNLSRNSFSLSLTLRALSNCFHVCLSDLDCHAGLVFETII